MEDRFEDMNMYDAIRAGKYKNDYPYPGLSFKRDDPEFKRKMNAYRARECELIDQFKDDLEKEFGMTENPLKDQIYSYAWEHGHSSGFTEVYSHYDDLASTFGATAERAIIDSYKKGYEAGISDGKYLAKRITQ